MNWRPGNRHFSGFSERDIGMADKQGQQSGERF